MPLTSLWRNGDKMFSLSRNVTWSAETSRTFHAEATRTTTFTSHRNITLNKSSALSKRHIQPADLAPVFFFHHSLSPVIISPPPPLMKASIKCSASPEHPPGHLGYRNIWTFLNQQTEPPPPPSFCHSPPPVTSSMKSQHSLKHQMHFTPSPLVFLFCFLYLSSSKRPLLLPPIRLHLQQHFSLIAKSSDLLQTSL